MGCPHDLIMSSTGYHPGGQLGVSPRGMVDRFALAANLEPFTNALPKGLGQADALFKGECQNLFGQW